MNGSSRKPEQRSYYEILNVPEDASQEDIRRAYQQAMVTYGKNSLALYSLVSEEERAATLERVEEAFRILGDAIRRSEYDGRLAAGGVGERSVTEETPQPLAAREEAGPRVPMLSRIADLTYPARSQPRPKLGKTGRDSPLSTPGLSSFQCASEVGGQLRSARETKGLSFEAVADRTKIRVDYLKALEEGDYEQLPKGAYRRLMLAAYARVLDLDPAALLKKLDEAGS